MNWRNVWVVFTKELCDTLRDRRTLLSTLVLPTLAMPLLLLGVGSVANKSFAKAQAEVPQVAILGGAESPAVRAALAAHKKLVAVPAPEGWRRQIADKQLRAAVEIPDAFDAAVARGEPATVKIYHFDGELRSGLAVSELRRFFGAYRDEQVAGRLAGRGLPASFIKPFELRSENVAPPEKVGGNAIGGLIPYVFILFCFAGALYPAIDLTAGEKERGTLETILCSPVARTELVLGKFFLVLTASLTTVVCSLASMGLSAVFLQHLTSGNASAQAVAAGAGAAATFPRIDPLGLLAVGALVVPVAALFSSLLLALSLFAKSAKEAQSYASPLILVVLLPAMMSLLPGVELDARLALVPVLNLALVSKELVSGVWHWGHLGLILGSSCLYAAAGLALCVRMFNRESVLFRA
jgi:sodium transport system permease protein